MMCQHCNFNPATQRELISTGGNDKRVYFSFTNLCKACSLRIGYDQNTITAFIEYAKHMKEGGADLNIDEIGENFPNGAQFIKTIMQFNTEKSYLELSIKSMLKANKGLFILSLINGNKAIKGELYSERCKNPGYLALDFPLKNDEFADWVVFKNLEDIMQHASYKNYMNIKYIVQLKEFSLHENCSFEEGIENLYDDILNLFKDDIPQIHFIIILTQVEKHKEVNILDKYPYLNHLNSRGEFYFSDHQSNIEKVKILLKTKIDSDYIYN